MRKSDGLLQRSGRRFEQVKWCIMRKGDAVDEEDAKVAEDAKGAEAHMVYSHGGMPRGGACARSAG